MTDTPTTTEQEFDAAFAEFSNAAPPGSVATPDVQQPDAGEAPEAEPTETTPNASTESAPDKEPEDELTVLRRQVADLQHRERSASARVSSFHRQFNAAAAQVEELTRRLEAAAPKSAATDSPPSDSEDADLAALSKEMPELGRMVDRLVTKKVSESVGDVQSRVQQIEQGVAPLRQQAQQEAERAELAVVEAEFPNWNEIVHSPDFGAWIAAKPPAIKAAWDSAATGADGLEFLRMYDREVGAPKPQDAANDSATTTAASVAASKQRQLERSVGLPSRSASKPTGGMPAADDFEGSFAYFNARQA